MERYCERHAKDTGRRMVCGGLPAGSLRYKL